MRISLTTLMLLISLYLSGQQPVIDPAVISSTVDNYLQQTGFSGTVLVAQDGQPVYHQSFGLAYRSTPDTIQNDYHYSVASVTKLFTSIRILQLVESGQLEVDASLVSYLPEFLGKISEGVTLHHLLLHISGLPNEKDRVYRSQSSPREVVWQSLASSKKEEPGTFNYNNVDYMLLGLLIEKVTGNSWEKQINAHILEPLDMTNTGFLQYGYYPGEFAYTYRQKGNGFRQDPLFYIENFYAAGSMYSTSLDLLKLDQALYSDVLLSETGKQLLAQSYPAYNYTGYSVWNYNYPFVESQPTVMERRGGILGANVVLIRLTDDNYTIIILSNDNRFNPDSFGDEYNLREMLIRALYP